jgi:hypothetical protein
MKKLHEIVNERVDKSKQLQNARKEFEKLEKNLNLEINELIRLENISTEGVDLEKVQLAETIIYIRGNPFGIIDGGGVRISDLAISDIAKNCEHLKTEFYGNKTYEGYYQRCNCSYGMGPRHGGIRDEIGLNPDARKRDLTSDEKDACIYYINNYSKIKEQKVNN